MSQAQIWDDSVFMDGDEKELFLRFQSDNPSLMAFEDTDSRRRNVEECLVEVELEKLVNCAHTLTSSRRAQLSKEARIQTLPFHHNVPSVVELREQRNKIVKSFDLQMNGQTHAAYENIGQVLGKEVALSTVPTNTLANTLATLASFYRTYLDDIRLRQSLLTRRWFSHMAGDEAQVVFQKEFSARQMHLHEEFRFCREILERTEVYSLALNSKKTSKPDLCSRMRLVTLERMGKVPMQVREEDAHAYLSYHVFQQRVRRRFERFSIKAKLIPHYKRYDLFDRLIKHLLGGADASTASEPKESLPTMVTESDKLMQHLEELCAGFKLTGYEKADLHEFVYHLGKRYSSTHDFQSRAWKFEPLSLYCATKNSDTTANEPNEPVYLRPSPWASQLFSAYFPRTQPDWELEQLTAMQTVTSLSSRSVATTESDHIRIDLQLEADFDFVAESDCSVSGEEWRKRSQNHMSRANSSVPVSDFDRLIQLNNNLETERVGESAPSFQNEEDALSQQRIQAVYQLRHLRTRQFRLQILKIINYCASLLKEITRDCRTSFSLSGTDGAEGLHFSAFDERRRDAVSPMVTLDASSEIDSRDDFDSRLLASLGLDKDHMSVESIRSHLFEGDEGTANRKLVSPHWLSDTYDTIDYGNSLQRSTVRDGMLKVLVMEEWALAEMQRVEQRMLFTASFYVNKHHDKLRENTDRRDRSAEANIDTTMIVEDMYECELWFQQSKLGVIDSLREAYMHSVNCGERSKIAKSIVETICAVPRIDLSDSSFLPSFTNQVVVFDLASSLAREVIQSQIEIERKVLISIHSGLKHSVAKAGNAEKAFGIPLAPSSEPSLFKHLFPRSSIINIFDVYSSIGVVESIMGFVDGGVQSFLSRFSPLRCNASILFLQKEILQELLVQWRLLGDEEIIARQIQGLSSKSQEDDTDVSFSVSNGKPIYALDSPHHGGFNNPMHVIEVATKLSAEKSKQINSGPPSASEMVNHLSAHVKHSQDASLKEKSDVTADSMQDIFLPQPTVSFQVLMDAMEGLRLHASLMSALYETEIWCGIHRMQAKLMGVNVKKSQLNPIDFDGKRVFIEGDELETAIQSSVESFESDSMTNIFSLSSQLALEEVLSLNAEFLETLSVCEFEKSMGDFDLRSMEGIERMLRFQLNDFRRAFSVQITNKNLYTSVVLCNMSALDNYIEGLYRRHAQSVFYEIFAAFEKKGDVSVKVLFESVMHREVSSALLPASASGRRLKLLSWPLLMKGETEQNYFVDRRHLQKLFISANQIKSVHRKCALQEMTHQATVLLGNTKDSDSIRSEMKKMKEALVDRYCKEITLSSIQYATKYHICSLGQILRNFLVDNDLADDSESLLIFGGKNDVVRSAPRFQAPSNEAKKPATCMITKNGLIDECRYVPHVAQVMSLSFEMDSPISAGVVNVRPDHFHLQGLSHLKQNFLLDSMCSILHDWLGIIQISRAVACTQVPAHQVLMNSAKSDVVWRSEIFRVASDLESLKDPTDISSVRSYLHHRHVSLFLCTENTLRSVVHQSRKLLHEASSQLFSQAHEKLLASTQTLGLAGLGSTFGMLNYFPRYELLLDFQSLLADVEPPALYEPLRRIVAMQTRSGDMIDAVAQDYEGTIDTNAFDGRAWYSPLQAYRPLSVCSYIQFPNPYPTDREIGCPYEYLRVENFLSGATPQERLVFFSEFARHSEMIEDCVDDAQEFLSRETDFQTTFMTSTLSPKEINKEFSVLHYEVAISTARRDSLQELYMILLRQVTLSIPAEMASQSFLSNTLLSTTVPLDEVYQRSIVHRSRILWEKELADPSSGKHKKKGRCVERDLRARQCRLLIMEIHKLLMIRTCVELTAVISSLESEALHMSKASISTNRKHAVKTAMFSEFCSLLVAKAHCTRGDGDKVVVFHIPEHSLNLAMETLASKLLTWESAHDVKVSSVFDTITKSFSSLVVESIAKRKEAERSLELMGKSLARRVHAGVASAKFEVIRSNAALSKQNEVLRAKLSRSRLQAKEEVRLEYEDKIADLQARIKTRESQFASYKQKLFRDMQESLEDVRRNAMFSISSMEHAPVHVKRQALKIAISDDELNTLKEQNSELRQAIIKLKLWYEIKLARMAAHHEQTLGELKSKTEGSQETYWNDRGVTESEVASLKRDLSALQFSLTKSELEVEVLRKDLQSQLNNKKDLIAWKLQSGKQIDELQRKLKRFERLSNMYDLEKLVAEHEKRLASNAMDSQLKSQQTRLPATVLKGQLLKASLTRIGNATDQVPPNALVPFEEYKRLQEQCDRERKMKEQAFQKIDSLRQGDVDSSESSIWQRRYFESASELKRRVAEIEALKAYIDAGSVARHDKK